MPVRPTQDNLHLSRTRSASGGQSSGEASSSQTAHPAGPAASQTPSPARGENLVNPLGPTAMNVAEAPAVTRQNSGVGNSSYFSASEHGSNSHPGSPSGGRPPSSSSGGSPREGDLLGSLSWFDRSQFEMAQKGLEQTSQSLKLTEQSLVVTKWAFGASLAFGAGSLILAGLPLAKGSDDSAKGPDDSAKAGSSSK